jgi:hypothetical protein
MRTTLNLPDSIALQAKRRALDEGTTLTDLIVQGLKARLGGKAAPGPLPVSEAVGGLKPGIDWNELAVADGSEDSCR